jgi:hypothetical protein
MALFANIILCDNVYVDRESGKPVLAGVYSGDVTLTTVPARIRWSIYAEFLPPKSGSHKIDMKFFLDKKQVLGAMIEARDTIAGTPALLMVPQFELGVDKQGTFAVKVSANGGPITTLLRKQIIVRTPSAQPPTPQE